MNQSVGTLITSVTMLLGSLVMMAYTNAVMMVVTVLSCVAGFALMFFIVILSQKLFGTQQEYLGKMNGHVAEITPHTTSSKCTTGRRRPRRGSIP